MIKSIQPNFDYKDGYALRFDALTKDQAALDRAVSRGLVYWSRVLLCIDAP